MDCRVDGILQWQYWKTVGQGNICLLLYLWRHHHRGMSRTSFWSTLKIRFFFRPYRIPLRIKDLTDLHIYIKDKNGGDASFLTGESTVTLVFRQQWKSCLGRLTFLVRLYGSNFNTPTEEKTLFQWFDAKRREVGGCLTNEGLIWFQSDLPRCPNQTFSKCRQW